MTPEAVAEVLVGAVQIYLIAGLMFAVPFVLVFAGRMDPNARGASWGFRILVIPGAAMLWPLLLLRVIRGKSVPEETNAHRRCALRTAAATKSEAAS